MQANRIIGKSGLLCFAVNASVIKSPISSSKILSPNAFKRLWRMSILNSIIYELITIAGTIRYKSKSENAFFPSILTALVFTQTNPAKIKINKTTTCFTVINASSIIISLCYIFHCLLYICLQCEYSTRKHGCPVFFYTKSAAGLFFLEFSCGTACFVRSARYAFRLSVCIFYLMHHISLTVRHPADTVLYARRLLHLSDKCRLM